MFDGGQVAAGKINLSPLFVKERGKHFDPEMIDAFFIALDSITAVGKRYV